MGEGLIVRKGQTKAGFSFRDNFSSSAGWSIIQGTFNFAADALTPNTRAGAGTIYTTQPKCCDMSKSVAAILDEDFEINCKFSFLNSVVDRIGHVLVSLRKGTTSIVHFVLLDGWGASYQSQFSLLRNGSVIYTSGAGTLFNSFNGVIKIKRVNGVATLYKDGIAIANSVDLLIDIDFDNIVVEFGGGTTEPLVPMQIDYVEIKKL